MVSREVEKKSDFQFAADVRRHVGRHLFRISGGEKAESEEVLHSLEQLYACGLEAAAIKLPTSRVQIARLGELIFQARFQGQSFPLVSPACPDYSHHVDPLTGKDVYDFRSLGESMGLNTSLLLRKAAVLMGALGKCSTENVSYSVYLADVEADDPEILASVGLKRGEFLRRVETSREVIKSRATERLERTTKVGMMSSFLKEEDYSRAEATLPCIKRSTIDDIAISRLNLYSRWFRSEGRSILEFNELCKRRAKEDVRKYLTFGSAARREGVVVLEATAPEISALYNFGDGRVPEANLPHLPSAPIIMIETEY